MMTDRVLHLYFEAATMDAALNVTRPVPQATSNNTGARLKLGQFEKRRLCRFELRVPGPLVMRCGLVPAERIWPTSSQDHVAGSLEVDAPDPRKLSKRRSTPNITNCSSMLTVMIRRA